MADGVSVEKDGVYVVRVDGVQLYSSANFFEAGAFSNGFMLGLESRVSIGKESDVVAETVRALDDERDEPVKEPVELLPGDRVKVLTGDNWFVGYVEKQARSGSFWVRIPFLEGNARMLYRRDELTFLGREPGEAIARLGELLAEGGSQ